MDNVGFVVAGYLITAVSLAGYALLLRRRARRARRRAAALASRR
jgi:nitrate reductase gamma subunit